LILAPGWSSQAAFILLDFWGGTCSGASFLARGRSRSGGVSC